MSDVVRTYIVDQLYNTYVLLVGYASLLSLVRSAYEKPADWEFDESVELPIETRMLVLMI